MKSSEMIVIIYFYLL